MHKQWKKGDKTADNIALDASKHKRFGQNYLSFFTGWSVAVKSLSTSAGEAILAALKAKKHLSPQSTSTITMTTAVYIYDKQIIQGEI